MFEDSLVNVTLLSFRIFQFPSFSSTVGVLFSLMLLYFKSPKLVIVFQRLFQLSIYRWWSPATFMLSPTFGAMNFLHHYFFIG